MNEQSIPPMSTTPCRSSNSITLEIITAAETLWLLSRARVSNSSSAPINYNTNRCSRNNNNKKNVSNKKVIADKNRNSDVPYERSSSKKRKKHDDVVDVDLNSGASCSHNVGDELDEFKLNSKKSKLKHIEIEIDDSSTSTTVENNVEKVINKHPVVIHGPNPPPDLPDNIKSIIRDMGGNGVLLITQKWLTATDVNSHNNRLQIPLKQIINANFLTDQETQYLTEKDVTDHLNFIETLLIDPALNQHKIAMRRWLMCKKFSKTKSENYVLNKPWIQIVKSNGLKEGNLIQLWGFRVGQQLHLVLLKLHI